MRISNGRIQSSATHALEKLEVSKAEASRVSMVGNRSGGDNSASLRRGSNILMDRVTFSRSYQRSSQSASRYEVQTRSRVSSAPGESREIQEEKIIQNLVGAAFDAEVVVGQMRRGRMPGGEGDGTMSSPPGGEGRTVRGTALSMSQSRVTFQDEELQFQTQGSVLTEDGRSIEFSLNLTMDQTLLTREKQEQLLQFSQDQISLVDPLMVSLDGGVPQLSDTRFEFDLNNDGETEMVHFAAQGSGFLAFDRDQDGKINNGSELFGPGTGNGFGELATWDGDGNNWIDENDAVFDQLSVWVRDGQGEDRLIPLREAGIGAISLDNTQTAFSHVDGENRQAGQLRQSGVFLFENGKAGLIQQVDLAAEEIV
ncbi:MAG: hypothetical protein MI747_12370, partial [Desulfobacterales bacterium]|nr:hypothetical protein [Desulfobacterales bacterium]